MFRFHKTLDIVTLFHKAGSPASVRAANILKQVSANAAAGATEDQASDHSVQTNPQKSRAEFELNITEEPPTADQVKTILEYVGKNRISSIVKGASTEQEALRKFQQNSESFQRPVTVDWNNGKAVVGDSESEILKMLNALNSEKS
ncbi:putative redox protein fmp46, mitochondrial [Colletotrichum tanaceti]|uniref:Putative redox protein fmp46, mitochondrial n=1 Tax=Colletotrichum tanaceti TaxID=1306861 RepID=A0A4U6X932_9PEZI|nr:putative redox protein fmp46, mitochondrial [Colletotrichum tanaceti]TKW51925.1 putative redox protein fmp46, mitochondrial [Colletotrichum tanaceti]